MILVLNISPTNCEEVVSAITYISLPVSKEDHMLLAKETPCLLTWTMKCSWWVISEDILVLKSCVYKQRMLSSNLQGNNNSLSLFFLKHYFNNWFSFLDKSSYKRKQERWGWSSSSMVKNTFCSSAETRSVPRVHDRWLTNSCNSISSSLFGSNTLFWPLWAPTHEAYI